MSGTPSPKQSSSSGSAASFIKGVEQLIQSDQQEILAKKMIELQINFPVLKKINQSLSNQQKLTLLVRDNNFRQKLVQKLIQDFGIEKIPIVKIQLYTIRYRSIIEEQLDQNDLIKIFNRFGKISSIYVNKTNAYLQFQTLISGYFAIKALNQFQIIRDSLKLTVRWCKPEQQILAQQCFYEKFNSITTTVSTGERYGKFNCKYRIHLPCSLEFKTSQKIIGPNGKNMKRIFEEIGNKNQAVGAKDIQKNLKMRLRGRGSGYKEGPNGEQSDEILNFCISSKQKLFYDFACSQIQKILDKISKDFKFDFQRIHGRISEGLAYQKFQMISNKQVQTKSLKLQQLSSNLQTISNFRNKALSVQQIQEQIHRRQKVRKSGRYRQADEIRQKLKLKGVLLIDGTGKKNTYATTWKYINE